jgi:hypothetical protein
MEVWLSALSAGRPLPPGRFLVLISVKSLSRPQGHSTAGRIRPTERSNDLIGNRNRELPAFSIVPQPTTLLRATAIRFFRNRNSYSYNHVLDTLIFRTYSPDQDKIRNVFNGFIICPSLLEAAGTRVPVRNITRLWFLLYSVFAPYVCPSVSCALTAK